MWIEAPEYESICILHVVVEGGATTEQNVFLKRKELMEWSSGGPRLES